MGMLHFTCVIDLISLIISEFPVMKERPLFYGYFYAFSRVMSEIAAYVFLIEVDEYDWTIVFKISIIAAVSCIGIAFFLFHRERMQRKVPLYQFDWWGMFFFTIALAALSYVLTMGLTKDWFESESILACTALFITTILIFYFIARKK